MPKSQPIQPLKSFTHPSLSGKSKITHRIGVTSDGKIHIGIVANDGGGFFGKEWVPWTGILQTLKKASREGAITSMCLTPLLKGKSVNTSAFLLSALVHHKVVTPKEGKSRVHELQDVKPFLDAVQSLKSSVYKPQPTKKKAPPRRKKTTSKK